MRKAPSSSRATSQSQSSLSAAEVMSERRALLRGRFDLPRHPRPIGALAPMAFEEACTQCGDCARACPEGILMRDAEGFPVLDC